MMSITNLDWPDYFYIDPSSESGIRWKVFNKAINPKSKRYPGDVAGFKKTDKDGTKTYYRVKLKGKNYQVHRIVWELVYGTIPDGFVINHKDCNGLNNKIENLEICTQEINMRRRKDHVGAGLSNANKSGFTGVFEDIKWNKDKTRCVIYAKAFYSDLNGRQITKSFRYDVYGKDQAFELAKDWRQKAIEDLNVRGAGYAHESSKQIPEITD